MNARERFEEASRDPALLNEYVAAFISGVEAYVDGRLNGVRTPGDLRAAALESFAESRVAIRDAIDGLAS